MKTSRPATNYPQIHHSGDMRWVSAVESHADHSIVHASIDASHLLAGFSMILSDDNTDNSQTEGIDALAGIELMAQSVAASVADRFPERSQHLGFLLGMRRYSCIHSVLAYGDYEIEVRDSSLFFNEGIGIFDTRLLRNGEELATGQLKAFLANNIEQQQAILDDRLQ